ncbi:MAG: hypothetical protein ACR5KW_02285 [Wolbachia sp.]
MISENIFLNKAATNKIIEDIFPYKFNSEKKNNISRLDDLYNIYALLLANSLPKEMLKA